uniref:Uncharacterized protein n=1 Tax=Anguilla anguilla TaxID=7936 RepID=A0A0E9VRR5_ANGAN
MFHLKTMVGLQKIVVLHTLKPRFHRRNYTPELGTF